MLSTGGYTSYLTYGLGEDDVLTSLAMLLEVIDSQLIPWALVPFQYFSFIFYLFFILV
jgi:hypothetical protein